MMSKKRKLAKRFERITLGAVGVIQARKSSLEEKYTTWRLKPSASPMNSEIHLAWTTCANQKSAL